MSSNLFTLFQTIAVVSAILTGVLLLIIATNSRRNLGLGSGTTSRNVMFTLYLNALPGLVSLVALIPPALDDLRLYGTWSSTALFFCFLTCVITFPLVVDIVLRGVPLTSSEERPFLILTLSLVVSTVALGIASTDTRTDPHDETVMGATLVLILVLGFLNALVLLSRHNSLRVLDEAYDDPTL